MPYNRRAMLEVYFIPQDQPARKESAWYMTKEGLLLRQNLVLSIFDLDREESRRYFLKDGVSENVFYRKDFYDTKPISSRVSQLAVKLSGTHNRAPNGFYTDASFSIHDKGRIIEFFERVAVDPESVIDFDQLEYP